MATELVHLDGAAHAADEAHDHEPITSFIEEVTCSACRDHIRAVGEAFMRGRRNGSVPWLGGAKVTREAYRILEEFDPEHSAWKRFDLRRWLTSTVGDHIVTLRVRAGKED